MRRPAVAALALALLLAAAACGDGGDSEGSGGSRGPAAPGRAAARTLEPSAHVERAAADPAAPVDGLVAGFNGAGFALWRAQPAAENLVFSPTSVGHALLMARAAADRTTGAAIDRALALPGGAGAHEAWNAIDRAIRGAQSDDVTAVIADRIWPAAGTEPAQEWIDLLAAQHGAGVEVLDLQGDPEGSREVINGWVGEQTEGLIPELLPAGFVDPTTVLVLTDAMYFEARWQIPFGKYPPVDGTFTTLDGRAVPVEFMRELELADRRGTGDGFAAAEIPYAGGDFSMLVIVPDEGHFEEFRRQFDQDALDALDAALTTGPYELLLPQWDDTSQIDLLAWLTDLGAAPGSYPLISPEAFLGAAVHAADIAVDEHGTVAAAATALGFNESGPPEPELTIAADRPFLYLIRHRATGLVLFAGQVTDPT